MMSGVEDTRCLKALREWAECMVVKVKQKGRVNTHLVDSEPENRSH